MRGAEAVLKSSEGRQEGVAEVKRLMRKMPVLAEKQQQCDSDIPRL